MLCHFWAILDHFGSFLGNFGPFWVIFGSLWSLLVHFWPFGVIFGPFWIILGHSWAILGHFRSFGVIFGPFLGHFVALLDKFAESSNFFEGSLGSGSSLLECMIKILFRPNVFSFLYRAKKIFKFLVQKENPKYN